MAPPVVRVRKAYEQVYDQLRDLIIRGELPRGERLPGEIVLAREFGVSRGTVREALRALAAHNLIRTAKGAGGGSFVTLPTVDHVSEFLEANISLLSEANDVTLEEFLETRRLLEVFAARQCALRRDDDDLERLRETILEDPDELGDRAALRLQPGVPHRGARRRRQHAAADRRAADLLDPADQPEPRDDEPALPGARQRRPPVRSSRRSRPATATRLPRRCASTWPT